MSTTVSSISSLSAVLSPPPGAQTGGVAATSGVQRFIDPFPFPSQTGGAMAPVDADQQAGFAAALCAQLRESRRRQGLTQAQVAARTGGQVSKAALANYETGHRSLRIDVFWVISRALGEDCGKLIAGAERSIVPMSTLRGRSAISVRVADVLATTDESLAPIRRWFSIRHPDGAFEDVTESLGEGALRALSNLTGMTVAECRDRLLDLAVVPPVPHLPAPSSGPDAGDHRLQGRPAHSGS